MNPLDTSVPSPCVQKCRLDSAKQTCTGCQRTRDEIALWSRMSSTQKLAVWARLKELPSPAVASS